MDMKRKWMILVALSVAIVFLAIAAVTASSWKPLNSPLYTVRMEHASSDLNFLPTEVNNFTYSAERGYNFGYNAEEGYCSDAKPLATSTSFGCNTCEPICLPSEDNTCCNTCGLTCVNTCYTCVSTCSNTCVNTCSTCVGTCPSTCAATCY